MNEWDKKLREIASREQMPVPITLHDRIKEITENRVAYGRRNISVRIGVIAAAIALFGTVTAGAVYYVANDGMGGYISPRILEKKLQDSQPFEDSLAEKWADIPASVWEEMSSQEQFDVLGIEPITPEQEREMYENWETWDKIYQDPRRQEEAQQAAIDAFYAHSLWPAEVAGARYEHVQECFDLQDDQVYEVLVVLYLSDGCGYRMHLDCETLELLHTTDLLPEVMEDEYFDALWNGTVEEYFAEAYPNAEG